MLYSLNLWKAAFAVAVLTALLPAEKAQAATLLIGNSRGTFGAPFVNPSVDSDATFRVENPDSQTEAFLLGEPGPDSDPNQLSFTGQEFSIVPQQVFSVGELTYRNGQTFQGTNVSGVPLSISLTLTQPSQAERSFDYRFTFNLTPNTDQMNSDDKLVVSENPAPQSFSVQQEEFSIELLGFSPDDGNTFTRSFQIPEDQSVNSTLFAQITSEITSERIDRQSVEVPVETPMKVPEPAVIPGLLILGAATRLKRGLLPAQR